MLRKFLSSVRYWYWRSRLGRFGADGMATQVRRGTDRGLAWRVGWLVGGTIIGSSSMTGYKIAVIPIITSRMACVIMIKKLFPFDPERFLDIRYHVINAFK